MRSRWMILVATLAAMALWAAAVIAGAVFGWWHTSLAPAGDADAFVDAAKRLIDTRNRGNTAFRLIENGATHGAHFVSIGDPVDADTLFQVASLSKWVTAWGVLALVEEGKLDLDAPVSRYLTRWKLPDSEFDHDEVTVRRLLSHTAGLADGLGFAGYAPAVALPSLEEALAHPNASSDSSVAIRVGVEPGSQWQYSGGGYLILQLLIEEVTGESFEAYMRRAILGPLGLARSTFTVDASTPNVATFYDVDGSIATHYRFTEKAAASLYTSASDMTQFVRAHFTASADEPAGRGVLTPDTLKQMRRPHASSLGADIWGLGVMLFAPIDGNDFVIGHDGNNDPAINTAVRLNPATHDGIIVFETGDHTLASTLAGEWVYWQTGVPDFLMLTIGARSFATIIIAGWVAILLVGLVVAWRSMRRR